jgi:hypothetical protein
MDANIAVMIAKALLYPGLLSFALVAGMLIIAGEWLSSRIYSRKRPWAGWADLLSWLMSWNRIRAKGERIASFISLILLTLVISALPTYSKIALVDCPLNYALIVLLLTAHPLAHYLSALLRGDDHAASPLVLFYGVLVQLSLLAPGLAAGGWELARVGDLAMLRGGAVSLCGVAALFCLAMLYVACRSMEREGGAIIYRLLDRLFLLAGAAVVEVGYLGFTPGWAGLAGLAGTYIVLRVGAELIIRYRLTTRAVLYARLTGFVIVFSLIARELF